MSAFISGMQPGNSDSSCFVAAVEVTRIDAVIEWSVEVLCTSNSRAPSK